MKRSLPRNILEIIIIYILAYIGVYFSWGFRLGNSALDINLHDTYFIITFSLWVIRAWAAVVIVTIFYLITEPFYGYKRIFQNITLLTGIVLSNMGLLLLFRVVLLLVSTLDTARGWTIYPPLSALPMHQPKQHPHGHFLDTVWLLFISLQIFFMAILIIVALLTGKNWNRRQTEELLLSL